MKIPKTLPEPSAGHAWRETRPQRGPDERLRRHGFTIHARPKRGPVLWARRGEVLPEAEAVRVCDRECEEAGQ